MIPKKATVLMVTLPLAACAATGAPPPLITYDRAESRAAVLTPESPRPVEIVTVPEPLPLPGQLKPMRPKQKVRPALPPQARVDARAGHRPSPMCGVDCRVSESVMRLQV